MRIYVWQGCRIAAEFDVPEAPGPDLQLDPWNDKLHVVEGGNTGIRGGVVKYHAGLLGEHVAQARAAADLAK